MDDTSQVLIFGDQAVDVFPSFSKLCSLSKQYRLLEDYLTLASDNIKSTAKQYALGNECVIFEQPLLELYESYYQRKFHNVAIDTVLSCVNQLGWLI